MKNIKEESLKEMEVLFSPRSSEPFILQSPGALNELFEKGRMKTVSSWAWNKGESHKLYVFNREKVTETHDNVERSKCRQCVLLDYGREGEGKNCLSKHILCIEMICSGYKLMGFVPYQTCSLRETQ